MHLPDVYKIILNKKCIFNKKKHIYHFFAKKYICKTKICVKFKLEKNYSHKQFLQNLAIFFNHLLGILPVHACIIML